MTLFNKMLSNKEEYADCISSRGENFSTEVLFIILVDIFEDLIIMYSSQLMICFVQYHTFTVYHVLRLHSMFLLFTGVVAFLLSLVLRPWYFLFSRIYESLKTRKVLFNFIISIILFSSSLTNAKTVRGIPYPISTEVKAIAVLSISR